MQPFSPRCALSSSFQFFSGSPSSIGDDLLKREEKLILDVTSPSNGGQRLAPGLTMMSHRWESHVGTRKTHADVRIDVPTSAQVHQRAPMRLSHVKNSSPNAAEASQQFSPSENRLSVGFWENLHIAPAVFCVLCTREIKNPTSDHQKRMNSLHTYPLMLAHPLQSPPKPAIRPKVAPSAVSFTFFVDLKRWKN